MTKKIPNDIPMSEADIKLWALEGWNVWFSNDSGLLEVMRIDDPGEWEAVHGYPVPLLKSDDEAKDMAKNHLELNGYAVVRRLDGKTE